MWTHMYIWLHAICYKQYIHLTYTAMNTITHTHTPDIHSYKYNYTHLTYIAMHPIIHTYILAKPVYVYTYACSQTQPL